ncbi:AAA family ATPase [Methylovulum psychrotolerans]|uniref:ATP-binding protein n=1 Tax=Methylovulum psychrotolerans TaxID=1704499 RepID=A0A2S5CT65_9GAMM|nr:AAA family ATPase [Methylovulum psychrotolerans]POZ53994.1 ATP-binding protein [Methylovulum psychrotolerans]
MRLVRVQVPEFRALKDVDITFEPNFYPQVFPLGSLNGGGKSTLLQLIFVLLHCTADEERHPFIANMLDKAIIPEGQTSNILAKFELLEGDKKIELEFTLCNDGYLRELDIDPIFNKEMVSFGIFARQAWLIKSLGKSEEELWEEFYHSIPNESGGDSHPDSEISIGQMESEFEYTIKEREYFQPLIKNIKKSLIAKNQFCITSFYSKQALGLICNFSGSKKDIKEILTSVSKRIFLSAPSTQIYLFLNQNDKQQLFKRKINPIISYRNENYEQAIEKSKGILPNFLTYDVFATDTLVHLIETARNQDFKTLVDTGTNGLTYQKTIEELNALTRDKTVLPLLDDKAAIIGVVFKTPEGTDIYPEDLSHGELKRLSLYVWLKLLIPQDENIILMDEIENGLHLDWQYTIVRDLLDWGKTNQYILATHSYELCTALTPAHVKEIELKPIAQ